MRVSRNWLKQKNYTGVELYKNELPSFWWSDLSDFFSSKARHIRMAPAFVVKFRRFL